MNRDQLAKLLQPLYAALARLVATPVTPSQTQYTPPSATIAPTSTPTAPRAILAPTAPYDWSSPEAVRHSVRVIADEEGLNLFQKNLMCQVIHCESGWNIHAINHNMRNGKVVSTDFGLCQINDYYHIGPDKDFPSADYVMNNPEACVRWMCKMTKNGLIRLWVCYSGDYYHRYTP